jgi:hypothetical protein
MKSSISMTIASLLTLGVKVMLVGAVIMFTAIISNAQTFAPKGGGGGGFDASTGQVTDESVNIDGKVFNLLTTESGSRYIKCTSARTGNDYAVWVGTPTEYKHEGRVVYKSSKGSYCILKISDKSGNPYAVWLDME